MISYDSIPGKSEVNFSPKSRDPGTATLITTRCQRNK